METVEHYEEYYYCQSKRDPEQDQKRSPSARVGVMVEIIIERTGTVAVFKAFGLVVMLLFHTVYLAFH